MWSVNQMFYGTEEPVWLVDATSPSAVNYHYLGSAHKAPPPPPRYMDSHYDSYRSGYSPPRSRPVHAPSHYGRPPPMPFSSVNPPPAPIVVPRESPLTHTPVLPVAPVSAPPPNTPYTLLLKVPICCEGCERRVVKKLLDVDGVMSVRCDIDRQRVTVRGVADTDEVLRVAKKAFKKSRLW